MENIEFAIKQLPELTDHGVGIFEAMKKTPEQRKKQFNKDRKDLLDSILDFEKVGEWLKQIKPIKTMNKNSHSYGMKHMVERDLNCYLTNGVFIAAAICSGFKFKTVKNNPNVYFNMSERSINVVYFGGEEGYRKALAAPRISFI